MLLARPRIQGLARAAARKDWTLLGRSMAGVWSDAEVAAFRLWLSEVISGEFQHYHPEDAYHFARLGPERLATAAATLERDIKASLRVALATRVLLDHRAIQVS